MMTLFSVATVCHGHGSAVESDPKLAGPGTVRAREEIGIAGGISGRLSSFPGLLDL